jgi:hypothetical protein
MDAEVTVLRNDDLDEELESLRANSFSRPGIPDSRYLLKTAWK